MNSKDARKLSDGEHCLRHTCVRAPGDREFSAGHSLADGGSPAIARTHSRVFFPDQVLFSQPLFSILHPPSPSPSRPLFPSCIVSLSQPSLFGSYFPLFGVSHPISHLRQSTINLIAPTGSNLLELGSSHFAHRWLAKEWRIQPCDLKFYCPPSFSALLPLIGRSREGPQRPPPSPIPGRKAATCDGPQVSMPSH